MDHAFTIGLSVGTQPPLRRIGILLRAARALRFDVAWVVDHFLGLYPTSIWDEDFSWLAKPGSSPHSYYDYQTLLGYLAPRAGSMRLAVGVTEPIRRHPVLIAQAFLTLSHMVERPPILGIGAGERENIEPYGLSFEHPVGRLEEALEVIRLCFTTVGPISYVGRHFRLDQARMDLPAAPGRMPELWVAAHAPRMLELAGRFGDGWYPTLPMPPGDYEARLATIRSHAAAASRDPDRIVPGYQKIVVIGRTESAARKLLDTKAIRFAALLSPAELWEERGREHPLGGGQRGYVDFVPQRHGRSELEAAMAKVDTDLVADLMVWGTPRTVEARLADYRDAGLRHLALSPASALVSRSDAMFSLRAAVGIQRRLKRSG
jgi:phthiodiolone/phenolphthiodiolone dimycocerosates ketoreductase